jgi:hypothetical protein
MLKSKEKDPKTNLCHFCEREKKTWFLYDLHNGIHDNQRSKIPVCGIHFNKLCNMSYANEEQPYLSAGQKEYISVKRLELKLGVNTKHSK